MQHDLQAPTPAAGLRAAALAALLAGLVCAWIAWSTIIGDAGLSITGAIFYSGDSWA